MYINKRILFISVISGNSYSNSYFSQTCFFCCFFFCLESLTRFSTHFEGGVFFSLFFEAAVGPDTFSSSQSFHFENKSLPRHALPSSE